MSSAVFFSVVFVHRVVAALDLIYFVRSASCRDVMRCHQGTLMGLIRRERYYMCVYRYRKCKVLLMLFISSPAAVESVKARAFKGSSDIWMYLHRLGAFVTYADLDAMGLLYVRELCGCACVREVKV